MTDDTNGSGWAGWVAFIGILMVVAGFFQGLMGLLALFNSNLFVVDAGALVVFDLTTWGWVHLVVGVLLAAAGFSVLKGHAFGRTVGVILAALSLIGNLALLGYSPVWSVMVIALDVLVIYGLAAHGNALRTQD